MTEVMSNLGSNAVQIPSSPLKPLDASTPGQQQPPDEFGGINEKTSEHHEVELSNEEKLAKALAATSRIEALEKKLASLTSELAEMKSKSESKADSSAPSSGKKQKDLVPEIKRLPMDKWQPSRGFTDEEITGNVLIVYYKKMQKKPANMTPLFDNAPVPSLEEKFKMVPQRVQINSRPLLDELEMLTGLSLTKVPCIMIPPFKVFTVLRDDISKLLETNKKAFAQKWKPKEDNETAAIEEAGKKVDEGKPIGPLTEDETAKKKAKTSIDHLRCLLDFIDTDLGDVLQLRHQIEKATLRTISFENLWHLFNPGDFIFSKIRSGAQNDSHSYPRAFVVNCTSGGRPILSSGSIGGRMGTGPSDIKSEEAKSFVTVFNIDCFYTEFNGTVFSWQSTPSSINEYEGEKEITDLDFYPAKFHPDYEERLKLLLERGNRFTDLCHVAHKKYRGLTTRDEVEEVESDVVVDFKTGWTSANPKILPNMGGDFGDLQVTNPREEETFELARCGNPECSGCTNNFNDFQYDRKREDQWFDLSGNVFKEVEFEYGRHLPSEQQLITLPRDVLAYIFRSRSWNYLDVDLVQDIDEKESIEESGFDDLVIPKKNKALVLALVENHSSGIRPTRQRDHHQHVKPQLPQMDIVKGKGKGLVILLHGVPGVGKTSTAETVAAYTRRPLYPITCGDIGTTAKEVEQQLEHHFKLAHKWGCVLLLDEADVFLMKRDKLGDVGRNALVSVFLRTLEYYSGILFLTTNRVATIDEAFKSRIHIQLYYPALDETSTVLIWEKMLSRLEKNKKAMDEWRKEQKGKKHEMKPVGDSIEVSVSVEFEKDEIIRFARQHYVDNELSGTTWNGRQIRNAFQTATALAQYDRATKLKTKHLSEEDAAKKSKYSKATLKVKHFKQVAAATREYYEYLAYAHSGRDDAQQAAEDGIRADNWDPSMPQAPRLTRELNNSMTKGPAAVSSKRVRRDKAAALSSEESDSETSSSSDSEDN